ncbi:MAG: hypothetical protein IJ270_07665 [Paludibacteraceae bacterium]|nr:hypothetical protein [Paludibacteraceae bacterium]
MQIGDYYVYEYDRKTGCSHGTLCCTPEIALNQYNQYCKDNENNPDIKVYVTIVDNVYYDIDGGQSVRLCKKYE